MKNTKEITKFKKGDYFRWDTGTFIVDYIDQNRQAYIAKDISDLKSIWTFFKWDEDTMTYISKEQNPEYYL